MPTLWLYSENDSFFGPELARNLHKAYTGAGGQAELTMFGPVKDDGHKLWNVYEGQVQWLPVLDRFLLAHGLPTWDRTAIEAKIAAMPMATISGRTFASTRPTVIQ